jgi:hypothetical protein
MDNKMKNQGIAEHNRLIDVLSSYGYRILPGGVRTESGVMQVRDGDSFCSGRVPVRYAQPTTHYALTQIYGPDQLLHLVIGDDGSVAWDLSNRRGKNLLSLLEYIRDQLTDPATEPLDACQARFNLASRAASQQSGNPADAIVVERVTE